MRIEGLAALNRKLARMPAVAKDEVRKALNTNADEMVALATALAPVADGDLKASIRKEPGRHDLEVTVKAGGGSADHAAVVEFGHSGKGRPGGAAPTPFFWPAYRSLRKRFKNRITRAMNATAQKVAANGK